MAVVNPPSFMQNVATEQANSGRMMLSGLVPCPGVVGTGDLKSVQHAGTPGMSIDIPGGQVWLAGTESGIQGTYHAWSDSTVTNPSVAASDPTNPRIDRIVAKVRDQFYSTAFNQWDLAVVTGIAKAVPLLSDAPAPNNSYTLGSILVTAAKTSILNADITDLRNRAVGLGAGGILINGIVSVAVSQGPSVPPFDITSLIFSPVIAPNRRYKLIARIHLATTVANDVVQLQINDVTGAALLDIDQKTIPLSGGLTNFTVIANIANPPSGVRTYKVTVTRQAGTGNLSTNVGAGALGVFSIEDVGPN
jgi:hypothetical protein